MKAAPSRGVPRPPGQLLRRVAQRFCSRSTLVHVVDPIVADMQHEWDAARERSSTARACVRLAGYAAFGKALALRTLTASGEHLVRNAFGTSREERSFYRRAASTTAATLLLLTLVAVFGSSGSSMRSLAYVITHQRWPGGPAEAEALQRAAAIALRADALANLVPCALLFVLPASVLFGILLAARMSLPEHGPARAPRTRWVGSAALTATIGGVALAGWLIPQANQNYREIVFSSVNRTARAENVPMKGSRELNFGELGAAIQQEKARNGKYVALYRTEWHKRVALPAACTVLGFLAIGLVDPARGRSAFGSAVTAASVGFIHYWLMRVGEQVLMPRGVPPFLAAWSGNLVLAAAAIILIVRRHELARPPEASARPR